MIFSKNPIHKSYNFLEDYSNLSPDLLVEDLIDYRFSYKYYKCVQKRR